jgi:hypothetical protein
MNYTKPQIDVLGDAKTVINYTRFKLLIFIGDGETLLRFTQPAYDLDE